MQNILTYMTFIPLAGMFAVLALPSGRHELIRKTALAFTIPPLLMAIWLYGNFDRTTDAMQFMVRHPWIPSYNIQYLMGVDGLSVTMILLTALITGFANLLFSDGALMGASGVVFMMILLASMANVRGGEIPLTFIAVAVIYMGGEIVRAFRDDQVSQMAHLVGGMAGAAFGFIIAGKKRRALAPKGGTAAELQKILGGAGKKAS